MKFSITDFFSKCDQICSFLEKHDIISDVIIPIAAILKNIFYIFFVTLQSMTKPKFLSKTFSYQDLGRGHYVPHSLGHDQTKIPLGR